MRAEAKVTDAAVKLSEQVFTARTLHLRAGWSVEIVCSDCGRSFEAPSDWKKRSRFHPLTEFRPMISEKKRGQELEIMKIDRAA
jgi:hypothetical protein